MKTLSDLTPDEKRIAVDYRIQEKYFGKWRDVPWGQPLTKRSALRIVANQNKDRGEYGAEWRAVKITTEVL